LSFSDTHPWNISSTEVEQQSNGDLVGSSDDHLGETGGKDGGGSGGDEDNGGGNGGDSGVGDSGGSEMMKISDDP
jgi:hypothetical protein